MNDRQKRISLLSRINRGKHLLPSVTTDLSEALEIPVSNEAFVSLPESDTLRQVSVAGYKFTLRAGEPSFRKFYTRYESDRVFALFARLSAAFEGNAEKCFSVADTQRVLWRSKGSPFGGAGERQLDHRSG